MTLDPISTAAAGLDTALVPFRLAANSKVFGGLQSLQHHTGIILSTLAQRKLPARLVGAIHQPDGAGAARIQLEFRPASIGARGATTTTLTADDGGFTLAVAEGAAIPAGGLQLIAHGAHGQATLTVPESQIASNGVVGVLVLAAELEPLSVSIVAALEALVPIAPPPIATAAVAPVRQAVSLGEEGSVCSRVFETSGTVDRHPWGLFFRIVEPEMSIATHTREVATNGHLKNWMPVYQSEVGSAAATLVDRIPVDQPLSLDGFRDQIAGIDSSGNFTGDETVPMAASIGLGYVLRMAQQWSFQGLALGDLVYSLPLAPGEQQQIAVFERQDTTSVEETETFTQTQTMAQTAVSDTSTTATFQQAFEEMVNGSSSFKSSSSSASAGLSFGIGPIGFGGGGGSSSSSGSGSNSLQGSRDTTSQAAEATHSAATNRAAASLAAHRTGMRMASASESMGTTTKIITNHNHTHALTMQYWEVVRNYTLKTTVEGVTLACLIPMQVVRFMPPGQPRLLTDPSTVDSADKVMERYKNILRHLDLLQLAVPREYRRGLEVLGQFAANPTTVVESAEATAETVIRFELSGSFLACERISISAVTKRNTRVGPVQLSPLHARQPAEVRPNTFMTEDELTSWLLSERNNSKSTLQASLALPPSLSPADIVGFEIDRQFETLTYPLTSAAQQAAEQFISQQLHETQVSFGQFLGEAVKAGGLQPLPTVTLSPRQLEQLLGGPTVVHFYAAVETIDAAGQEVPAARETYVNDNLYGTVLPAQPLPIPALQLPPVLRFQDVLEIEKAAQHVVRNTTRYSRDLWLSMTPEETAIMLDGYTIGVPTGGLADASQMVPLLNCLENTVLGVFGNSLIMPFVIPQELADQVGIDPEQLQQALLDYQREAFVSPETLVSLPTRGVLGEAVLGSCASAEKIDLTRFWNWQDAPADTAPGIGMVQLPTTTPPLTTGVTAPNSLTNLPPLINNLITAPQPNTGLVQAMGQAASSQQPFDPTLTGQQQLATLMQGNTTAANQARSDALKTSQTMASQAMHQLTSLVGTAMGQKEKPPPAGGPTKGSQTAQKAAATGTAAKGAGQTAGAGQATAAGQTAKGAGQTAGAGQTPAPGQATGETEETGETGESAEGGAAVGSVIEEAAPLALDAVELA